METEVSLRKRLDGLPESSRYDSTDFCAPPVAPIETPPPANTRVSLRILYRDETDPSQLCQHTGADEDDAPELSQRSHRSFGLRGKLITGFQASFGLSRNFITGIQAGVRWSRKLITGIAVVLALGLSALAYFFLAPSGKTITQTAELAPSVPYPPTPAQAAPSAAPAAATPGTAPAVATPSAAPAMATPSAAPAVANSERPPEPVQTSPKVAQRGDVLYLQRPGVNIRSTPSPTGSALGTAPKGTRFKVTNRQGDWIQVESGRLKGWINAGFLAPSEPR